MCKAKLRSLQCIGFDGCFLDYDSLIAVNLSRCATTLSNNICTYNGNNMSHVRICWCIYELELMSALRPVELPIMHSSGLAPLIYALLSFLGLVTEGDVHPC